MCGIAGLFDPRPDDQTARRAIVEAMLARIVHRGPDGSGVFTDGPAALGCQRLAIVDVAGGHQPIVSPDVALVCNGELYEHEMIRAAASDYKFSAGSDVEVLSCLYQRRGDALLDDINGQFAFALYDRRRERLLLARDAFGISPLYWTRLQGGGVAFGSEIKALLAHPEVRARLDPVGVDQVFAFPGTVSPRTAFEGIHSLPPGHMLIVDAGGIHERAWWQLELPLADAPHEQRSDAEWAEALGDALELAVGRRLMGEAPVGCYLSGGLDSSLLSALLAAHSPGVARDCFSIGFARGAVDERVYQRAVIEATGARHHFIELGIDEIPRRFERMIWHAERPVKESYNIASLALAEAARAAGVKVVLSGEGADELFAGYPGYRVDARGPRAVAENDFAALLEADLRAQVFGARDVYYEGQLGAARSLRAPLYSEPLRDMFDQVDCLDGAPVVDGALLRGRHRMHQRAYLDIKLRLGDHLLSDHGDCMAMASSVEARYPLLDRDVVSLATRIPPDVVMRAGRSKAVLRAAARGRLPDAIIDRDKMGFHAPGTPTLLQHARDWTLDMLAPARIARHGLFDPDAVAALIAAYSAPGFRLDLPLEDDLLMVVLSATVLCDTFGL